MGNGDIQPKPITYTELIVPMNDYEVKKDFPKQFMHHHIYLMCK